jgi:hypothetical protein
VSLTKEKREIEKKAERRKYLCLELLKSIYVEAAGAMISGQRK